MNDDCHCFLKICFNNLIDFLKGLLVDFNSSEHKKQAMKKLLLLLLGMTIVISCNKEKISANDTNEITTERAQDKSSKIEICHLAGTNKWQSIYVSINAMPAHIAHGDIVPDSDGDGYTKPNPCGLGGQDDCDDNDAAIHPGATEICSNNTDDNCNGVINEDCFATVTICNQVWMLRNLDVATYRNGDPIPLVTDATVWTSLQTGAYCYYNNDSATYASIYGKLYNWYAVNDARGLAPVGWHVPTYAEWISLGGCVEAMPPFGNTGGKLKEIGNVHWNSPNFGATNSSGFTALPGGFLSPDRSFYNVHIAGVWWSSTEDSPANAWHRYLEHNDNWFGNTIGYKTLGASIRCVKD